LDLCLYTRDQRYREAAGRAAAWLEASPLPDGRWARFYELRTNRPLYMTSDYQLTYDDGDTPRHYSFKGGFEVPRTLERYSRLPNGEGAASPAPPAAAEAARALADQLAPEVAEVVAALDQRGRWLDDGKINSGTFVANVDLLARYVAATNGEVLPRLALLDH
jgi:hypothetical protein